MDEIVRYQLRKPAAAAADKLVLVPVSVEKEVQRLAKLMLEAAEKLDFEQAAECRDRIKYLREKAVLEP